MVRLLISSMLLIALSTSITYLINPKNSKDVSGQILDVSEKIKKKILQECQPIQVFTFDLDDVMSSKEKISKISFGLLAARIAFFHPYIIMIVPKLTNIEKYGMNLSKTMNGTSNIVHAMIKELKDQGYGNISYYEDEIIEKSVNPKPIMHMVEYVRTLRNKGHIVLGATNQDYKQYLAYRKNMKKSYGVDCDTLFNAVLTTRVLHTPTPTTDEHFFVPNTDDPWIYELIDTQAIKPDSRYFNALTILAQKISGCSKVTVIHTDDKLENILGARDSNLGFIEFELAGENARKTSPEDIEKTINKWQKTLKNRFGINLNS